MLPTTHLKFNWRFWKLRKPFGSSKGNPYRRVDGYIADMKYDPESRSLPKERVNDTLILDNEQYKIVEITNNVVRVQSIKNTKVTTIKWNGNP